MRAIREPPRSGRPRRLALLLLPLLAVGALRAAVGSPAQCCLGAQNADVLSADGRYRVVATSMNGTGPSSHGPYDFRFTTYRVVADGEDEVLGTFQRRWDSCEHFWMDLRVSPTGNGFLLGGSLQADLEFLAPDGTVLRSLPCSARQSLWPYTRAGAPQDDERADPNFLLLRSGWDGEPMRRTYLWLPLAHVVGPELAWTKEEESRWRPLERDEAPRWPALDARERRWLLGALTWTPARGAAERAQVEELFETLRLDHAATAARESLVALGLSARAVLRDVVVEDPELEWIRRQILGEIRARLCGHDEPWRHRELLEALRGHPDPDLRACALEGLRALGPR